MRYLFGFICVLALGVMGCGQSLGPVGGSGGDGGNGGVGGDGGNGGIGGGLVTDCTGVEDWTVCEPERGPLGACFDDVCLVWDCLLFEDGTACLAGGDPSADMPGVCEGGTCVAVEDCTGLVDGWHCTTGEDDGSCVDGECVAFQ